MMELILEWGFLPHLRCVRHDDLRTQERSPPPSVRDQLVISDIKNASISWKSNPFRGRRRKRIIHSVERELG